MRPSDVLAEDGLLGTVLANRKDKDGDTPLEVMDMAIHALVQARMDEHILPMRGITRAIARSSETEDSSNRLGILAGVSTLASGLLSNAGVILARMGVFAAAVARRAIFTAGRFMVERIAIPLMTGVSRLLLMTPVGWVISGTALSYFLYRTFFKRDNPKTVGEQISQRGTTEDPLFNTDGSLNWEVLQQKYLGLESALGRSPVRPGSAVATATAMNAPASAEVTPERLSLGRKILAEKRSANVKAAIDEASRRTGVNVGILNAVAYKESTFREVASPGTSRAAGLFQFIPSTWNEVLRKYGDQYGVPKNASRDDPLASAIMGAAYIKHEIWPSISKVVSNPSATDLYLGHFMGPAGGARWLRNLRNNPNGIAATDFPTEAGANQWVYYDRNGNARTYQQIYNMFAADLNMIQQAANEETQVQSKPVSAGPPVTSNPPPPDQTADDPTQTPPASARYTQPDNEYADLNGTPIVVPVKPT